MASVSSDDQRFSVENACVVRTPPGAAWNSSIASSDGASARMSHSPSQASIDGECTVCTSVLSSPPRHSSPRIAGMPPARCTSSMWKSEFGDTLARHGTRRETASIAARSKSTSPSCAAARMCSTVLVEPPIATSSAIAFSKAARVAMLRGSAEASSSRYQRVARSITVRPACSNSARRAACVARVEPLPGSARPSASVRQFIELAVNMPEHEPQVGQAERSTESSPASSTDADADAEMAVIRSVGAYTTPPTTTALPASIGPPETNTVGMFSRIAAFSMPGVILSQFEMQTSASAACPFTMYSTASAITSREGSE